MEMISLITNRYFIKTFLKIMAEACVWVFVYYRSHNCDLYHSATATPKSRRLKTCCLILNLKITTYILAVRLIFKLSHILGWAGSHIKQISRCFCHDGFDASVKDFETSFIEVKIELAILLIPYLLPAFRSEPTCAVLATRTASSASRIPTAAGTESLENASLTQPTW